MRRQQTRGPDRVRKGAGRDGGRGGDESISMHGEDHVVSGRWPGRPSSSPHLWRGGMTTSISSGTSQVRYRSTVPGEHHLMPPKLSCPFPQTHRKRTECPSRRLWSPGCTRHPPQPSATSRRSAWAPGSRTATESPTPSSSASRTVTTTLTLPGYTVRHRRVPWCTW